MTYPLANEPEKVDPVRSSKDKPIVVRQSGPGFFGRMWNRLLLIALMISIVVHFAMFSAFEDYYNQSPPIERYHSGSKEAEQRIAVIEISGVIMSPFTERTLKTIKHCQEDDRVIGVLLSIDSPGGAVADSHQIYHELQKLAETKPIYVSMKRMAASGGYYVAMGGGTETLIFAEPTAWTGSIGVILPRYNAAELAKKIGVKPDPIKTGPFKDTLNPFRDLTEDEVTLWEGIIDESFQRFLTVIADNRPDLDMAAITALATGQVYTANQALENKMIDKIGYEDEALEALKQKVGIEDVRVVRFEHPQSLAEQLMGIKMSQESPSPWQTLLESSVPRAFYLCSWSPPIR